ncbi:MAG TPA: diaminopimelate decarboxylase, partial [Terriglobales bacterium]
MKTRKARVQAVGRPPAFAYRDGELHCERVALSALAKKFGTPLYLYSQNTIRERYRTFDEAFRGVPHTICYSVKANSNLSLLKMLAGMGCGFDVVSGGELLRVLKASRGAAKKVVFSGVGKTADELDLALKSEILMFNVESEQELALLGARATELKREARIALRVNPDVAARTHPYISTGLHKHKFGVPMQVARAIYAAASYHPWLDVAGISVHIGSQITDVKPFGE